VNIRKICAESKYRYVEFAICGVFAIFYLWLAAQVPYTHDDWDWGLPVGLEHLLTANINGRYAGNFFEVVMTRSEVMKALIIGICNLSIPLIIASLVFPGSEKAAVTNRIACFLLGNILLLTIKRTIWQQTLGWIAGYANFGISAVFLLIVVRQLLRVFHTSPAEPQPRPLFLAAVFVCTLVGQLFLENVAIYVVLASSLVLFLYYKKTKRISRLYLLMVIAGVIGIVLLFNSSIYATLWSDGEAIGGNRQLHMNSQSSIRSLVVLCLKQFAYLPSKIWADNLVLCLGIILLLDVLLINKNGLRTSLRCVLCIVNTVFACVFLFHRLAALSTRLYLLSVNFVSGLFFLTILWELYLLYKEDLPHFWALAFLWASPLCLQLPLVFTSESGARLFLTSNVLLMYFAAFLFRSCLQYLSKKQWLTCALGCISILLILYHGNIYSEIGACKQQRDEIIADAIATGADAITLPQYPHLEYLWLPNPLQEHRLRYFKGFFGLAEEVTITFEQ